MITVNAYGMQITFDDATEMRKYYNTLTNRQAESSIGKRYCVVLDAGVKDVTFNYNYRSVAMDVAEKMHNGNNNLMITIKEERK